MPINDLYISTVLTHVVQQYITESSLNTISSSFADIYHFWVLDSAFAFSFTFDWLVHDLFFYF